MPLNWEQTRLDRRRFLTLAGQTSLVVTTMGLLSACGGDDEPDAPAQSSSPVAGETPAVEDTVEPEETPPAVGTVQSEETPPAVGTVQSEESPAVEETTELDKALRFVWLGDVLPLWHPAAYQTFGQAVVFTLIFNNLVKLDEDLATFIPDLAGEWEISPDATQFTFKLRDDVSWHDGEPFTASDVVFSFTRQIVEPYRFTKFMDVLQGAAEYLAGDTDTVEGIEQVDTHTVRFTIIQPDVLFLNSLAEPGTVIVPEHILNDVSPDSIESIPFTMDSPIGTGPYKFVQYLTDQYVEFDVNPDYFKGQPAIGKLFMKTLRPEVTIAQLESGEVDLALRLDPKEQDRLETLEGLNIISLPGVGLTGLSFPTEQEPVSDKRVRQAVYYAIDRHAIVDAIFAGRAKVLRGAPPAMDHFDGLNPYEYDPDAAMALLQEAGYDSNAPFRIVYNPNYPAAPQYYPVIEQQLAAVGFNVQLEALDPAAMGERATESRDTFEIQGFHGGAWGLGPHATADYYDCMRPDFGSGYGSCELDELFAEARTIADPDKRAEVYREAALLMNEDLPRIPLWTPNDLHASTNRLGGGFAVYGDPRRTFTKVETWTLD